VFGPGGVHLFRNIRHDLAGAAYRESKANIAGAAYRESKANTYLIAAAPEMYEALEEAASRLEVQAIQMDSTPGLQIGVDALLTTARRCRSVLARARGEAE
jgi:RNase P/RNase MRP subunit p30